MSVSLLVVEDKDKTLQSICTMIEPLGFEVTIARDGLDGLSKAKQQYFDIILLDHKMPVMDGLSLLKNLRELEAYQHSPLLFMSTQDMVEIEPKALKAGATQCLAKPLHEEFLLDTLKTWAVRFVA
ncbi:MULTISPECIES: response regulator [Idiomarina]|jgi:two-component system chemotaxis response regulator CheY|uniref:response regulator n=1 Tax=Idiomarina TaxID=135575 RepID=UPI0006C836A5|nr:MULTISPECIES: response regulator [Idiomarina]KPD20594.1 chemotaxis protein CheY [Idiomarina abyssalis]MAO69416.1 response regulator [Idiomarina sp.]MBF80513.1 response regulator [Idiomarina sp.]MBP58745.1 response regulator [Idiomarina sp.]SFT52666.1 two-component system, chemotaxis family, response regulator CheY [Idiomarina abyssalis]|tara:strand:- start:13755 stop:14132 length:378 start_codon:yes stop_codon:yes gene_type:complete